VKGEKKMKRGTWIVAFTVAVGLALSLIGQAWAQYPPPAGSVVLAAGDATPGLGVEVAVTATVLDSSGLPAAGVACTFHIAQQPGGDASVDPGPVTTDAAGNVSTRLQTGSTAGTIAVEAVCGELSALVSVVASAGQEGAAPPPASLPDTGVGATPEDGGGASWVFWGLIAAGMGIGLGGLATALRRPRAQ
jgi:hypothetical protein